MSSLTRKPRNLQELLAMSATKPVKASQRTLQPQTQHYLWGGSVEYAEAERRNL